jgi:Septin
LTIERLLEVKEAVTRDLRREGLGVGVVSSDTTGVDLREYGNEEEDEGVSRDQQKAMISAVAQQDGGDDAVKMINPNGHVEFTSSTGRETTEEATTTEPIKVIRIPPRSHSEASNRHRRPSATVEEADHPEELDTPTYDHLLPFAILSPEDPTGRRGADEPQKVFVRRFKWGQIEVLNPDHCDFTPLRETLLGNNMKVSCQPWCNCSC